MSMKAERHFKKRQFKKEFLEIRDPWGGDFKRSGLKKGKHKEKEIPQKLWWNHQKNRLSNKKNMQKYVYRKDDL